MSFIRRDIRANTEDHIEHQVGARIVEQAHGVSMEQQGLKRPRLKETKSETEREIERCVRRYSQGPEQLSAGKVAKLINNITFSRLSGNIRLNEKEVAGRL